MVNYTCECCSFSTHIKSHYERHLGTNKHKKSTQNQQKVNKKSTLSQQLVNPKSKFECRYCKRQFTTKQAMYRHVKYTCKKNEDEDLKELVRLLNLKVETMEQSHKRTQHLLEKEIEKRGKQIEKLSNKLQINNSNIITNNYNNVTLLDYKNTDTSHLTHDDYVKSIYRINNCVKILTEKIHYNPEKPENMNIYISNLKNNYVTVYENGEWVLKKGIDDIYDHKEILLEEWIENEQDNYPELRDKFEKYLQNKEDDNIMNNIKEDIKLMMYNKKKLVIKNQQELEDEKSLYLPSSSMDSD